MDAARSDVSAHAAAMAAFNPGRFGFRPLAPGWMRDFSALGPVVVATLDWQHAQLWSYLLEDGRRVGVDALELVVELQRHTWGMTPEELVPANVLAVLTETRGTVLVAYRQDAGFNADGWLGFVIGFGSHTNTLISHMLGVREEARGRHDIGWYLKVLQGYEALRAGYTAAAWTFDPMRGANARLNLEKLGAVVEEFTVDKYGSLHSSLYGDVPSDRFTARWELLAPRAAERIALVAEGSYQPPGLDTLGDIPIVTSATVDELLAAQPPCLGYRIPGDIDQMMRDDPATAIAWRQEMRHVFAKLVTTKAARLAGADPVSVGVTTTPGDYLITGIATGFDEHGDRQSVYLLRRKSLPGEREAE